MFMTAAHSILPAWGRASVSARLVSRGAAFNPMRTLGERLAEVVLVHWQGAETHTPVSLHKRNLSNWNEALLTQDSLWPHTLLQAVLRAIQPGPVWESIFREAGLTRSKHHDKRTFWHSNLLRLLKVLPFSCDNDEYFLVPHRNSVAWYSHIIWLLSQVFRWRRMLAALGETPSHTDIWNKALLRPSIFGRNIKIYWNLVRCQKLGIYFWQSMSIIFCSSFFRAAFMRRNFNVVSSSVLPRHIKFILGLCNQKVWAQILWVLSSSGNQTKLGAEPFTCSIVSAELFKKHTLL